MSAATLHVTIHDTQLASIKAAAKMPERHCFLLWWLISSLFTSKSQSHFNQPDNCRKNTSSPTQLSPPPQFSTPSQNLIPSCIWINTCCYGNRQPAFPAMLVLPQMVSPLRKKNPSHIVAFHHLIPLASVNCTCWNKLQRAFRLGWALCQTPTSP